MVAVDAPAVGQAESSSFAQAARRPPPILPDLTPLRATDLSIQYSAGKRRLRFEAGLANIGLGPMEVRPNNVKPCRAGKRHASQIIYRDADGSGHFDRHIDTGYTKKSS